MNYETLTRELRQAPSMIRVVIVIATETGRTRLLSASHPTGGSDVPGLEVTNVDIGYTSNDFLSEGSTLT